MKKPNLNPDQSLSLFNVLNILKTSTALLLLIAGLQSTANAGQGGDGGAGIHINGQYMTFYSAGVKILGEKKLNEIPGLEETINSVNSPNMFNPETIGNILLSLLPSNKRTYYDIDPSTFDKETEKKLIAEYAKITGQSADKLTLYAITDTKTGETFLFPNFYKLKKISQQAILFHESRWILNPTASYKEIIREEMIFEKYITNPNDLDAQYELISKIGTTMELLQFAAYADRSTGAINDNTQLQYKNKTLTFNPINTLGTDYFLCQKIHPQYYLTNVSQNCMAETLINLVKLQKQFPNSYLLNFVLNQISTGNIRISFLSHDVKKYKSSFLQISPIIESAITFDSPSVAQAVNSEMVRIPFLINMGPYKMNRLATLNPNWEHQSNESWTDIVDITFSN